MIQDLINDEAFMTRFIAMANISLEQTETFEKVYYRYEGIVPDEEIRLLIEYCEENNLLDY